MVDFNFDYNWLRTKQFWLGAGSNVDRGVLIIADEDGNPFKYYYYEDINYKDEDSVLK
jgi:hypothetical protein